MNLNKPIISKQLKKNKSQAIINKIKKHNTVTKDDFRLPKNFKLSDLTIKDMVLLKDSNNIEIKKYVTERLREIFDAKPLSGDQKRKQVKDRKDKLNITGINNKFLKFLNSATSSKLTLTEKQILRNLNKQRLPENIKLMEMSGDEPRFRKWLWGAEGKFIENQNCYAYAMNQFRFFRHNKSVPGYKRGALRGVTDYIDCKKLTKNIIGDAGKEAYVIEPKKACKKGTYKIMLFITSDKEKYSDFHFYRQDADGTYSHKQGTLYGPSKLDASGNIIFNPIKSNRNFSPWNYDIYCSSICIPKEIKTNI